LAEAELKFIAEEAQASRKLIIYEKPGSSGESETDSEAKIRQMAKDERSTDSQPKRPILGLPPTQPER
jgi:hypothetical protein